MCPKEIYSVLMQEFAGFHKTSVDVRYRLILGVNNGANTGATPDGSDHVLSLIKLHQASHFANKTPGLPNEAQSRGFCLSTKAQCRHASAS